MDSEASYILAHLPLVNQGALTLIPVLDGILDGNHMSIQIPVQILDHGRQGGGFTAAGGAGDQNQASGLFGHLIKDGGHLKILQGGNPPIQQSYGGCQLFLLPEHIHALPLSFRGLQGKVRILARLKGCPVPLA